MPQTVMPATPMPTSRTQKSLPRRCTIDQSSWAEEAGLQQVQFSDPLYFQYR
jgi:hypothetical protein